MTTRAKLRSLLSPNQATVAIILQAVVIIVATAALFFQDLAIVFTDALLNEATSHVLAIPFIFGYLIYRKRKMLQAVIPRDNADPQTGTKHLPPIAGILLVATAILLYWYGSYTFTPLEYHMAALPLFTAGLTLFFFNPPTLRQLAFPLAFLILLAPPPTEILYALGSTLSIMSSVAANTLISAVGVPSTLSSEYGNPIITITRPNGTTIPFAIDIACSGIYSLIGFLIFALFIAYIIRDKPWKKLALFLVGIPLMYLLNIIRITSTLFLGYHYGQDTALQAFHLLGGFTLIFLGTLLLLLISEKLFKMQIFATPTEKCPDCNLAPEIPHRFCFACGRILTPRSIKLSRNDIVKLAAVSVSVALFLSFQAPVFALTQGPPAVILITPGEQVPAGILPEIPGYDLTFIYRDTRFEEVAKQDVALLYRYTPVDEASLPLWVTLEIASTRSPLHSWEGCLITWQIAHGLEPRATEIELKDIQLVENPPIVGRYFLFQRKATNETQAVLYWYEIATFATNSTSQRKHAKISVIAYPDNLENPAALETQLLVCATAIANYWQPIKTWSQITLVLSQNGNVLLTLAIVMLVGTVIYYVLERRNERKTNFRTYKKLPELAKQLVDATSETEKTTLPTLDNIATVYQNLTGRPVDKRRLLEDLATTEKTALLKSTITNKDDEPILVWRTQLALE